MVQNRVISSAIKGHHSILIYGPYTILYILIIQKIMKFFIKIDKNINNLIALLDKLNNKI